VDWVLERFRAAGVEARKEAFTMPAAVVGEIIDRQHQWRCFLQPECRSDALFDRYTGRLAAPSPWPVSAQNRFSKSGAARKAHSF
jgi:hypothetical protein